MQGAATVLRGEELLLLSKKTFSFRFSTFDEKAVSTLNAENPEKTNLIKYKIFLELKPIIKTLVSPSRVNTVSWDLERAIRGTKSLI